MSQPAPSVRVPADLPDLRLWLADQWMPGHPYFNVASRSLTTRAPGEVPNPVRWARGEFDALRGSTLWWVGEDMVDLLLATAAAVPDDVLVHELEAPSPSGMVVFEKPWWGIDAETSSREVQVDCVVWFHTRLPPTVRPGAPAGGVHCLSTSMYRRLDFGDGMGPAELSLAVSTGAIAHGERLPIGTWQTRDGRKGIEPDDSAEAQRIAERARESGVQPLPLDDFEDGDRAFSVVGESWVPLGRSDWPIEDRIDAPPWPMDERMRSSFVEDRKVIAALWTLLHTEGITSRVEHGAPRQAMRRTERAGIDRQLARVQVVTLRKARHATEDGDERSDERKVEHDHRWMVSGHYRWQPCGKGRADRRLTFIAPYIKGPDDKPLKVRDRVNAFVR